MAVQIILDFKRFKIIHNGPVPRSRREKSSNRSCFPHSRRSEARIVADVSQHSVSAQSRLRLIPERKIDQCRTRENVGGEQTRYNSVVVLLSCEVIMFPGIGNDHIYIDPKQDR